MKKIKLGVLLLTISLTTLTGCVTSNNKETKNTKSTTSSSTVTKDTSSNSKEVSSTKQSSTTDTDPLSLLIEASQSQIPSLLEQFSGTYSDITISRGEGDTLVYTYVYGQQINQQVDAEALKPTLAKGLKSTMDSAKVLIPDIKFQVIFLNPDKSEIANITITQEDTDNAQ